MGGISDYSGSVVLEGVIHEAAFSAVQLRHDNRIKLRSAGAAAEGLAEDAELSLGDIISDGKLIGYSDCNALLTKTPDARWIAYAAGCLYVLLAEEALPLNSARGLNILLDSKVPLGAGVSSSAAIEVAVMFALLAAFKLSLPDMELARLCQVVENRVVGAPCGIMDQVSCSLGQENKLLTLKCQPHDLLGYERIPHGWSFVGIDSHIKHTVGGNKYAAARIGAFMGLKILQVESRENWGGYLCNIPVDVWQGWKERIPIQLTGAEFLSHYGELPDSVTTVNPQQPYFVRSCTEHPILENDRVREFIALMGLAGRDPDEMLMEEAGQLMLESHKSYSDRVNLGSRETDLLVGLGMQRGPEHGIFGAKITGGGSGGTVVFLCGGERAESAIQQILKEYAESSGLSPRLMTGSSPGAVESGIRSIS